ncbi:MAG: ABC transporter substrate-binding protein [Acidimicrobiales bacterium]
MNWKLFDFLRRDVSPVELDLIESYARNKIGRRDFVKRGTIIGLSAPFMGAIIAACGDDGGGGDSGSSDTTAGGESGGGDVTQGGNLIAAVQQGDANTGLDPINMLDLGTYCLISQCFESLVGLGDQAGIGPSGLATAWSPNDDGSVWTFELRPDVKWQNGGDFTSADVAATMDRLSAQGNAGLKGVIGEGSVDSSDPAVAVITLLEPNGNFPFLVSPFNPQAVITPVDYTDGTTLNERPDGTGPWVLDSFDPTTFVAKYSRNPNWWGGSAVLDTIELRGFADIGTAVTAMASREIDVIQQFSVIGGEGLLNDSNFVVLAPDASNHRQLWFNTQQGDYTDKLVRRAMAFCLDREQMLSTLFSGRGVLGNDHPIISSLPFFDPDATPQRTRDIDMAKALLAEAGVEGVSGTIETGDLQEIPQLAAIVQQNAAEAGFDLQVNVQSNSTFYGAAWCPGPNASDTTLPCDGSAGFGIVDYGSRPVPDVFLGSALATGGVWNSSNYTNPEFDQLLSEYRRSIDVEGQKTAIGGIQKVLHEDTPACYPYFYDYLSGHDASVSGVEVTPLGHLFLSKAAKSS